MFYCFIRMLIRIIIRTIIRIIIRIEMVRIKDVF